jgi:hypothetical protein
MEPNSGIRVGSSSLEMQLIDTIVDGADVGFRELIHPL